MYLWKQAVRNNTRLLGFRTKQVLQQSKQVVVKPHKLCAQGIVFFVSYTASGGRH
jgi:hypothetical protein